MTRLVTRELFACRLGERAGIRPGPLPTLGEGEAIAGLFHTHPDPPVDEAAQPWVLGPSSVDPAPKAFANLALSDHFFVVFDNVQQSRLSVAWLKRYVDDDTRYTQFLSPGPATNMWNLKEYRVSGVN